MRKRSFETVAAVDLGSNSFHMLVARHARGRLHVLDKLRERVAIAEGLREDQRLEPKVAARALECLSRFGQRLRDMPRGSVRAVGTNTMRQLRDGGRFVARAEAALGHPIEIVSGREEARLVYLGVAHDLEGEAGRRLVVDIGGGSTECILGERFEPIETHSLFMGCVTWTMRFFPDPPRGGNPSERKVTQKAMDAARIAAMLELRTIRRRFLGLGWSACVGSSGTILTAAHLLRTMGFSDGTLHAKGLKRLRKALVEAGSAAALRVPGLAEERAGVLPGGLAILSAVVESLDVEGMVTSAGSLREGLIYDLIGRIRQEDVRDRTMRAFAARHQVDVEHAARVERTAAALFQAVREAWELDPEQDARLLAWAARTCEAGLSLAYPGYHKHGAYLIEHSELPGFSRDDQVQLAAIVRAHRGRPKKGAFEGVPASRALATRRLAVLLRLAVRLNRSRSPRPLPPLAVRVVKGGLGLAFPRGWLADHPLTRADLAAEARSLAALGVRVDVA